MLGTWNQPFWLGWFQLKSSSGTELRDVGTSEPPEPGVFVYHYKDEPKPISRVIGREAGT